MLIEGIRQTTVGLMLIIVTYIIKTMKCVSSGVTRKSYK